MRTTGIYKDIEITVKELKTDARKLHKHHFFELIYVLEGKGFHNINNNEYEFGRQDVFLLTPEDLHAFRITNPCVFCIIDFTASFFSKTFARQNEKMDMSDFFRQLEYIFHNHHDVRGNLIADTDKAIFDVLIRQLLKEKDSNETYGKIIIQNIVFLLLHLIARNIEHNVISSSMTLNPKNKIHGIIVYIQQNIYNKELIKLENIAAYFNKSSDYLNRYFKSQTGSNLREYILHYKLELVQTRLKFSDLNISEIAAEVNFTDESHLNKAFKKEHGLTAKQFRIRYKN